MEARNYQRVFQRNPALLAQMLSLRLSGWGVNALARQYHVDKSSVKHWVAKFNIHPKVENVRISSVVIAQIAVPVKPCTKMYKYQDIFDEEEEINEGKTYAEYVADHQKRDPSFKFRVNPYAIDPLHISQTNTWQN